MAYIIIGIVLTGCIVFFLTSCKNKPDSGISNAEIHKPEKNPFDGLRNMAFTTTPEQLMLSLPNDKTVVYGIIMDWGMSRAVATIVSYQTGDTSLYLSSGGGVLGGGQHQNISSAAKQFVNLAQTYLDQAVKTETTDLPAADEVRFYLLTNAGIFFGQEQISNFKNKSSTWLGLFEEGNKVLTELRLTTENK